ncbi:MAG: DNA-processing protein DprA [Leucobacter sp.]|nr:DNA-processing protein DprA [Leucobacter sp.]
MNGPARGQGPASLSAEPELRAKLGELARLEPTPEVADELLARVAWSRLAEPGDGIAGALIGAFGAGPLLRMLVERTAPRRIAQRAREAGLELPERGVVEAIARWSPRLDRSGTVGDIDRALAAGLGVVAPGSAHWPGSLDDLGAHAPLLLWVRGDPALLGAPSFSVVGARAATGYGTHITAEIVDGICQAGFSIVSGAAYGIDAVAHRTALAAEAPTVAVLAGGADRAYPAAHDTLLDRIAGAGLVCAEMIPGAAPTKWRFRMRNRLIASLSPVTLVTEAGVRSGTINTAGHAATLGRAIAAVPGPVTSAASAGCHLLIREYGAVLVTNAREACEVAGLDDHLDLGSGVGSGAGSAARMPQLHERVLDALPLRGGRTSLEVARRAGVSEGDARGALAELEVLDRVRRGDSPDGEGVRWALVRPQ